MAAKRRTAAKKKASSRTRAKAAPKATKHRAAKRKTPKRKTAARRARTAGKAARPAKKKAPRKQVVGEGDYEASRTFLKDQAKFVKKNKARIPDLGRQAEAALDGAEGASLRAAEARARNRSKAPDAQANDAAEAGAMVIPPG